MSDLPLLKVRNLKIRFVGRRGVGNAVNGVSFDVHHGEVLGLVGESGSGKSLTALAIVGLLPAEAEVEGEISFQGEDLLTKSSKEMRGYRGSQISMVLQDSKGAMNPVLTIERQLGEPLKLHKGLTGQALHQRAIELLSLVRIASADERLKNYPHQFSGGMRQRVVSAIALAGEPILLIADEPTTALDVTIQDAYLDLLRDIQEESNLGVLFITHDFSVIGSVCNRVAVMYAGRIVEVAPTTLILGSPQHPYTKALLGSVPDIRQDSQTLVSIKGAPPSIYEPRGGCRFRERCSLYGALGEPERCRYEEPLLVAVDDQQSVACHFFGDSG